MRKLVKYSASVVVGLALLALALPGLVGVMMANKYPQLITALNQSPEISVKLKSYQRGWFSSQATLQVAVFNAHNLADTSADAFDHALTTIRITQQLQHGPITWFKQADGASHLVWCCAGNVPSLQFWHTPYVEYMFPVQLSQPSRAAFGPVPATHCVHKLLSALRT